jgi:LysM repeat protein
MINELIFSSVLFFNAHQEHRDSLGTETVNGKVFVIHSVGEKETLYGISRRYGSSVESILQYNPSADAGLEIGQILKVPYTKKVVTAGNGSTHTVAAKETMYSISRLYGVSIDDIKEWNNLKDNSLSIGQTLAIKKSNTAPSTAVQTNVPDANVSRNGVHTVAAKETMFSISRQYGISMQQLKDWNTLEGNDISIGQQLIVSAPKETIGQKDDPKENIPVAQTTQPVQPAGNTPSSSPTVAEPKKEPQPTSSAPKPAEEQTIKVTETVKNTDEVLQSGLAELIEGTSGNRKYLALHRTAPIGTIMKVRNEMNNREVFVRVMGKLPDTAVNNKLVIKISKSAYDRLGAIDSRFRVEVTYYK